MRDSVETKAQKRAADFLKLYDTYFTSANVKVYFQSRATGKIVQVDTATGIGYNYSVSSSPIHVLGARTPLFFSRGSGQGQGALTLIFKDALYLKSIIKYIFDESMELPSSLSVEAKEPETYNFITENSGRAFQATVIAGVSIARGYMSERDFQMYLKEIEESPYISNEEKRLGIVELEKRKEEQKARPYRDLSDDAFKVLAKKTSITSTLDNSSYIKPQDVLDIGGIHMLFDIRIVLNNSTPYYNNTDTTIVLRDCKIVHEQLDTSSLQDGVIQQAFNFIFKTVSAA